MGTPHSSPHNETPPSLLHPSGLHSLLQAGDILRPCVLQTPPGSTNNKTRSSMVQTMDCYDYNNQGGDRLHLTDYTPSLRKYNFDNRIESCCFTGIWLLYDLDNYGAGSGNSMDWWAYGNNYCTNVPGAFINRGSAMCLYPESTSKCTPGFYSTRQSLGRLAGQVSSVRKGCYAKDKVLPDNHGLPVRSEKMGGMGAMGGSWFNAGNEE